MCKCENMLKCPNGTASGTGAKSVSDCVSTGLYVNRRVSVVPSYVNTTGGPLAPFLQNSTDFWQLGGADSTTQPLGEK